MRQAALLVALVFSVSILAGCVSGPGKTQQDPNDPKKLGGAGKTQAVFQGQYRFDGAYSQVLVEGPLKMKLPVRTLIKSPLDGADIEIGYWLPDVPDGTKVPVIVHASPYHRPAGSVVRNSGMKLFLSDNFLPHGYAVAAVAVRGTGDSGGCMDLMGRKEVADLDQAITWLGTQPWSNGNVAMIGGSYDGSTPWSVAATGNKHLKTIVPISGVPDVYGLMFRNGTAETRGPILLNYLYYTYGWAYFDPVFGGDVNRTAQHRIEGLVCPESWQGFAAALYAGATGERDPTGWWAERNRKPGVEKNYKGSILSVQGLQDWNVDPHMVIPWGDQLEQGGLYVKQMLGQWGHASPDRQQSRGVPAPFTRYDWAEILLHWFDYWLKGNTTVDLGPRVQVQDHLFRWRNEEHYPPRDANWTTYHLGPNNALVTSATGSGSSLLHPTPFVPNNLDVCVVQGVCVPGAVGQTYKDLYKSLRTVPGYMQDFSTAPFEENVTVAGLPRLHVTVEPQGPTGHLAAWIYDVDPTGKETRVGWTMMNLHFADGGEKLTPLTPGQPLLAKMQFQPFDAHFQKGHRLLLRVWQFQENDRLPGVPEPVELLWGASVKSTLELPIVKRDESAYFQPPMPPKKA